jgi:hypothetical protein
MPPQIVSLIHGVRRVHRRVPNRQWMHSLGSFLENQGVTSVTHLDWNGGLVTGFLATDAPRYATALHDDHRRALEQNGGLSIVAKSLGGLIAEKAIRLLQGDVHIDTFLRIAVPDRRPRLHLPGVTRVVNVISDRDLLFWLGQWFRPFFMDDHDTQHDGAKPEIIRLRGLSHFDLTELRSLSDGMTTYELYRRVLNGSLLPEEYHQIQDLIP